MTPVLATSTCSVGTPVAAPTISVNSSASRYPCSPVATLAFLATTMIARAWPATARGRLTVTLGPTNRFRVNMPALVHARVDRMTDTSSPWSRRPTRPVWATKPDGSAMWTRPGRSRSGATSSPSASSPGRAGLSVVCAGNRSESTHRSWHGTCAGALTSGERQAPGGSGTCPASQRHRDEGFPTYDSWSVSNCSRQRRISDARKRRWPPSVRIAVILPARAQRVTVFGLTRNSAATSAGVRSASAWGCSIMVRVSFPVSVSCINVRDARFLVHGPSGPFREDSP